jgi:transcriptional regulator with XRE-family HTH domain
MQHIGKNIFKVRTLLGVKQESLAYDLHLSQQTISTIERAKELKESAIKRIADALGVTVEAIINYNDQTIIEFLNAGGKKESHNSGISIKESDLIFELYEKLLQSEREKFKVAMAFIEHLQKFVSGSPPAAEPGCKTSTEKAIS